MIAGEIRCLGRDTRKANLREICSCNFRIPTEQNELQNVTKLRAIMKTTRQDHKTTTPHSRLTRGSRIGLTAERRAESKTSNCVTVMIPLDTNDCICHFVLNRDVALKSISKYRCSSITSA